MEQKKQRAVKNFRIYTEGNSLLSVDRVVRVLGYSDKRIELLLSRGRLCVCGNGLKMSSFFGNEIVIRGTISEITMPCAQQSTEGEGKI